MSFACHTNLSQNRYDRSTEKLQFTAATLYYVYYVIFFDLYCSLQTFLPMADVSCIIIVDSL